MHAPQGQRGDKPTPSRMLTIPNVSSSTWPVEMSPSEHRPRHSEHTDPKRAKPLIDSEDPSTTRPFVRNRTSRDLRTDKEAKRAIADVKTVEPDLGQLEQKERERE